MCRMYFLILYLCLLLFCPCRRSPAATTQPPITRVCLPGKSLRGTPAMCLTSVRLHEERFFSPSYVAWAFPCHKLSLLLFSPFPSLPPSSHSDWLVYVRTFTFFAFCLRLQHCSPYYFVIKLITLVQAQCSWYFRLTLRCMHAHTHTGL